MLTNANNRIDVFIRTNFTSDTNAMIVYALNEMADLEDFFGFTQKAAQYRQMATTIVSAMNKLLLLSDHYITQYVVVVLLCLLLFCLFLSNHSHIR